jgi:hypothetical protein
MRMSTLILLATVALLVSCSGSRKPNDANFTAAINQYLAKHGQACALAGREFPVDVPRSTPSNTSGIGARMTALEKAGLVSETDTTAVVHGMLDTLRGPAPAQPVRRYQLTPDGQKSFEQAPDVVGSTGGFCYGQKTVDRIVNWTQPETGSSQAEVTYTYRIVNLASWADRSDLQQAFPDIRATISGASRANQIIGLQLTNKGWSVPGP